MKMRIEVEDGAPDEVVIRCSAVTEQIVRLQNAFSELLSRGSDIVLTMNDTEYYIPVKDILFLETQGGCVAAHTSDKMYYSGLRLYELEQILPHSFVRVSKSSLINSAAISSIHKNLAGPSEVCFNGSSKKAYVSRMYYSILKEIINETRLKK